MTSYMQLPGFSGDSTGSEHMGWIEIVSFRMEMRDVIGYGKLRFALVQKRFDRASDALRTRSAGEMATVTFDVVDAKGVERVTLRRVELWRVSAKAVGTDVHAEPGEELEFAYESAEYGSHRPHSNKSSANSAALPQLFLSVPGIAGDAADPAHRGWIELKRIVRLAADGSSAPKLTLTNDRFPQVERNAESESGTLSVLKFRDSASDALQQATVADREIDAVTLDIVHAGITRRFQFEKVRFTQFVRSTADASVIRKRGEPVGDEATLIFDQRQLQSAPIGKAPTVHPVARAHSGATTERTAINLRPPKFFELALPVLSGEGGKTIYPPSDASVRLKSNRGYDRRFPVSAGMVTQDGFCSFRFPDIAEKSTDELFTATLERGAEIETIFKERRVATYLAAARKNGRYEPAFSPGPMD